MLKTRIITALVVLAIVLVALFAFPQWAWGVFTFAIVLTACWEWTRIAPIGAPWGSVFLILSLLASGGVLFAYANGGVAGISFDAIKQVAFLSSLMYWIIFAPLWLARRWRPQSSFLLMLAGWLVILPAGIAFLSMRDVSPWLLLSFVAIVWVADIAAYFAGRRFGRHKLALAISPGKTIEGAVGGMVGVILYFFAWQWVTSHKAISDNLWVRELQSGGAMLFGLFVLLGVLSVLGDLFESWMKRGAGLKDSSNLLPGHGGVLDRIDALTSTLPLAAFYLMWMMPAR